MLLPKHHFLALECPRQSEYQHSSHTQIHDHGQKNFHRLIAKRKNTVHALYAVIYRNQIPVQRNLFSLTEHRAQSDRSPRW